jgi:hypothetical protein
VSEGVRAAVRTNILVENMGICKYVICKEKLDIKHSQPKGFAITNVVITNFAKFPSISQHSGPR